MRVQPTGIPLRAAPEALRNAALASVSRAALASCLTALDRSINTDAFISKTWAQERTAELLLRAAVSPLTTATAELAHTAIAFLASLVPVSAGAELLGRGLQLSFDRNAAIAIPTIRAGQAAWVSEGAAIPVIEQHTGAGPKLELFKLASITSLTGEMVRGSNAEALMRQCLLDSTGPALDAALFSNSAGVAELSPPGLMHGIVPASATAGGGDAAMQADISALLNAIASHAGNGDVTFIAAIAQAATLSMRSYNFPYTILSSAALAPGTVIAVVNRAVVSAMEAPRVEASRESAVHFEDTTPADIADIGGVLAHPVKSLYQTDSVALRLIMPVSWCVREQNAIAWIQGTTW